VRNALAHHIHHKLSRIFNITERILPHLEGTRVVWTACFANDGAEQNSGRIRSNSREEAERRKICQAIPIHCRHQRDRPGYDDAGHQLVNLALIALQRID
jgi:hypothetical protein